MHIARLIFASSLLELFISGCIGMTPKCSAALTTGWKLRGQGDGSRLAG
jgi:hypothetical protein